MFSNYFLSDLIKGILMGIANIMPGVSGGTLAISFGVYDRIIGAISGIFTDFRKSFRILFPLMTGMAVGIICFAYIMEYLFTACPFPTGMAFTGLILGGMPALWNTWKKSIQIKNNGGTDRLRFLRLLPGYAALFAGSAAMTIFMSAVRSPEQNQVSLQAGINHPSVLFLLGIISAAAMVIPGVSGSLLLMITGYYYGILHAVHSLLEGIRTLDTSIFFENLLLLIPFAFGIVLGIFLFAKLVEYLFQNHAGAVYSAVLGMIAASPAAILFQFQTQTPLTPKDIPAGIIAFIFCFFISKNMEG
ncbi:MAG: DUF368 domain-containing protein [Lachnospiraceae bacterium]|nr:DUF368 domain-containing protein [Lachnospiraceae bacterium]